EGSVAVIAATLGCVALGYVNARLRIAVRRVEILIPGLPPQLDGLKIVQVTDIHAGTTVGRSLVERVTKLARGCKPDLLVLTGDMADGPVPLLAETLSPLAEIPARLGRFFVTGNHEFYWGAGPRIRYFE